LTYAKSPDFLAFWFLRGFLLHMDLKFLLANICCHAPIWDRPKGRPSRSLRQSKSMPAGHSD